MRRSPLVLSAAVGLLSLPGCSDGGELEAGNGMNVVLISLDSVRRDLLSAYGAESPHAPGEPASPHLDALAAQGVLFENAYATTSWTLPSHVTMLTGLPELVHSVDIDSQRPADDVVFLAEMLQARGYRTAGFFSGPYLEPHFGFDRGFDTYVPCYGDALTEASERAAAARREHEAAQESENPFHIRTAKSELDAAVRALDEPSHRDISTEQVTDAALEELEAAAAEGSPFFLFAHYFDPHYDYIPPEPFDQMFDPDYDGEGQWDDFLLNEDICLADAPIDFEKPTRQGSRTRKISDRDLENVRALYSGELRWTDSHVGRLLERIDELGLAEQTLVAVVADHGDEFFEHGSIGHRRTLYEEVVAVPMILRLPGVLPEGMRVPDLVSLADLVPTILDLLGIPARGSRGSSSFLPLVRGEDEGATRGVLGRLVRFWPMDVQAPVPGGGSAPVPSYLIRVIETWRQGSLAIIRKRAWFQARGDVPERPARAVDSYYGKDRKVDVLRWIDLEQFPEERVEDFSTDFDDPRALAALRAFHDRYRELLEERIGAEAVDSDAELRTILDGLGYVGEDEIPLGLSDDNFLFPPPGRELLETDH